MTQSVESAVMPVASLPVIRAMLDYAVSKDYTSGVLGIRARPEFDGSELFMHKGRQVKVVPCVSALAVREALLDRAPDSWLVVLTDRSDDDLGSGILSHFLWYRLRTPGPMGSCPPTFCRYGHRPCAHIAAGQQGDRHRPSDGRTYRWLATRSCRGADA